MPTNPAAPPSPTPAAVVTSPPPTARRWTLVAVAVALVALVAWGAGGPGRAGTGDPTDAALASSPANGEPVPSSPDSVSITFDREVTAGPGGISVVNADGTRVDQGVTSKPAPNQLRVAVAPDLPDGTYRADYRVLDPAGDVVAGHVAFGVGAPPDPAVVDRLAPAADPLVGAWSALAAAALLLGSLGAIGLGVFAVVIAPGGRTPARLVAWVRWSVLIGALGAAAEVVGRAADASGDGLGAVTRSGVLGSVLRQGSTGWWLVGLMIGLPVVYAGVGLRPGPVRQALVVYGALVAAGSFALAGHNAVGSSLVAGIGNAVHVGVAAVWLGGVVGLWLTVRDPDPAADPADSVERFTPLAIGSIVVLWLTGAVQTIDVVGSVGELLSSTWGVVLAVKLLVVVAVTVVAVVGRRAIRRAPDRVARILAVEAGLLVAVVLVTSLLTGIVPASTADANPQPTSQTLPVTADVDVNLLVTPGSTGLNEIHVTYLDDTGSLTDRIESVTVEMTLPFAGIGPIVIGGPEIEPGHYLVITENLTTAGVWRMDVVSRIGTTEQRRTTFEVPIGD